MFEFLASFLGAIFGLLLIFLCLWMNSNWKTHTSEWREEKLIDWLKRPLPTLGEKYRKKIVTNYPSEEWDHYPYLMIDAIYHFERGSDEVIKWTIHYSTSDKFKDSDKEYLDLLRIERSNG
jgi:hypothetical protein